METGQALTGAAALNIKHSISLNVFIGSYELMY